MKLTILGGAKEIGANSYYLSLGETGILLDAGTHPQRHGEASLPAFDKLAGEVEEILISHAHLDHVGALPVALKRFPRARVYMTGPTALLATRMLRNAVAVGRQKLPRGAPPLYGQDQVEWVEQVLHEKEIGHSFLLQHAAGEKPQATFFNAGHLLGAAGVLIEHRGQRFFYTGDTCESNLYISSAAQYPKGPLDALLLDSTHGADAGPDLARDRRTFAKATGELGRFINQVVDRGGSILIPVFALGRTQELLGVLYQLTRKQKIPPLPIFVSGLAHGVCRIYDTTRLDSKRRHAELRFEDIGYRLLDPDRWNDASLLQRPCVLLVSSGMMFSGTSSNYLASRLLPDPKHGIAFVGFLDEESPGYRVVKAATDETVDLGGEMGPVRVACSVVTLSITAHSRASQLVQTVKDLQPRQVILVHGDQAAVENLARLINAENLPVQVHRAQLGETFVI